MKTNFIIKFLIIAVALYTSVKVVSAQSSSRKIFFRFGEKQLYQMNSGTSQTKKNNLVFFARKTTKLEHLKTTSWFYNSSEWVAKPQESEDLKVNLKQWMLNAIDMTKINEYETANESFKMQDWMFDASLMVKNNTSSELPISQNWMFTSELWK